MQPAIDADNDHACYKNASFVRKMYILKRQMYKPDLRNQMAVHGNYVVTSNIAKG